MSTDSFLPSTTDQFGLYENEIEHRGELVTCWMNRKPYRVDRIDVMPMRDRAGRYWIIASQISDDLIFIDMGPYPSYEVAIAILELLA